MSKIQDEMKLNQIKDTIFEAQRFIERAEELCDLINNSESIIFTCKERSAAKRSSMDLSRKLTEFRKLTV